MLNLYGTIPNDSWDTFFCVSRGYFISLLESIFCNFITFQIEIQRLSKSANNFSSQTLKDEVICSLLNRRIVAIKWSQLILLNNKLTIFKLILVQNNSMSKYYHYSLLKQCERMCHCDSITLQLGNKSIWVHKANRKEVNKNMPELGALNIQPDLKMTKLLSRAL